MPSYTLIALLLSLFGAGMSLISALRSHHGDAMKAIKGDHPRLCSVVLQAHEKNGQTFAKVGQHETDIGRWLWWWEKAMIAPIWAFSVVVVLVSVVALSVEWPSSAAAAMIVPTAPTPGSPVVTTVSIATIDQFIIFHGGMCKSIVATLLLINIGCYAIAWFGQKQARHHFEEVRTLEYSLIERKQQGITTAT